VKEVSMHEYLYSIYKPQINKMNRKVFLQCCVASLAVFIISVSMAEEQTGAWHDPVCDIDIMGVTLTSTDEEMIKPGVHWVLRTNLKPFNDHHTIL
jgi:hypothetical protein